MQGNPVTLSCDTAPALIPGFLDGELSEEQAAPLRSHLLDCVACREVAKVEKSLKRWFAAEADPVVPSGFAARVARRAFAGDTGVLTPARPPGEEATILPFILRLTVIAAAVLILLAAAIQFQSRPATGDELRADDLDDVWEEIYEIEQGTVDGASNPAAEEPDDDRR